MEFDGRSEFDNPLGKESLRAPITYNFPKIARSSWTVEEIHESYEKLKTLILDKEIPYFLACLNKVAPDLAKTYESLCVDRKGGIYPMPRIEEFTKIIYEPLKRILLSGDDSEDKQRCTFALHRFFELQRVYSQFLRKGPLVTLYQTAKRTRELIDRSPPNLPYDEFKLKGQRSVYLHKNWFSTEIFVPISKRAQAFQKHSPQQLRELLFADSLESELDFELRRASITGTRGVLGGGHFDTRLSRLSKLPGIDAKSQNTYIVCSDKYTKAMVRSYLDSIHPNGVITLLSSAEEQRAELTDEKIFCKKSNLIFFGVGPLTIPLFERIAQSDTAKEKPRMTFLCFSNSPDAWTLKEKLGVIPF
jgi:hypothetical protein